MIVKIRVGNGPKIRRHGIRNRSIALAAAALLSPVSVMTFALGGWRLASDLRWTTKFAIDQGLFSYWQVWITISFLLQGTATLLNRYAQAPEE
jgi:hypothetical protein